MTEGSMNQRNENGKQGRQQQTAGRLIMRREQRANELIRQQAACRADVGVFLDGAINFGPAR